jgi:hypothetical protein
MKAKLRQFFHSIIKLYNLLIQGILFNYEVKTGLGDYEDLRQKIQYNIKH